MQYRITYPIEAERYIRAMSEESGVERNAVTEKLCITITAMINKAYYQGKLCIGERPAVDDNIARVRRSLEREEISAKDAELLIRLYYNEAAAFDAGRKERMKHDTI